MTNSNAERHFSIKSTVGTDCGLMRADPRPPVASSPLAWSWWCPAMPCRSGRHHVPSRQLHSSNIAVDRPLCSVGRLARDSLVALTFEDAQLTFGVEVQPPPSSRFKIWPMLK